MTGVLRHDGESNPSVSQRQRLTLDSSAATSALQSLNCLSHMFSWIPLDTAVTHAPASLLNKLFHFATFGCRPACDGQTGIGDAALCCVNELLSKNHVPSAACQQFVLALFTHTFSLFKSVIHRADATHQHVMLVRFDQLTHRCTFLPVYESFKQIYTFQNLAILTHSCFNRYNKE